MATRKFMFLYPDVLAERRTHAPSPKEMQTIMANWEAWKAKFKEQIVDMGDALMPGGKVLKGGLVTDGPYPESKEVVGGYSVVHAGSYEEAVEIARACPISSIPGARIEIREYAGYSK